MSKQDFPATPPASPLAPTSEASAKNAAYPPLSSEPQRTRIETQTGSRIVRGFRNAEEGSIWFSRLYVNNGETATLIASRHRTETGARCWAQKVLAS